MKSAKREQASKRGRVSSLKNKTHLCPLQFLKVSFPLSYNITKISRKPSVKIYIYIIIMTIKRKAQTWLGHPTVPRQLCDLRGVN